MTPENNPAIREIWKKILLGPVTYYRDFILTMGKQAITPTFGARHSDSKHLPYLETVERGCSLYLVAVALNLIFAENDGYISRPEIAILVLEFLGLIVFLLTLTFVIFVARIWNSRSKRPNHSESDKVFTHESCLVLTISLPAFLTENIWIVLSCYALILLHSVLFLWKAHSFFKINLWHIIWFGPILLFGYSLYFFAHYFIVMGTALKA